MSQDFHRILKWSPQDMQGCLQYRQGCSRIPKDSIEDCTSGVCTRDEAFSPLHQSRMLMCRFPRAVPHIMGFKNHINIYRFSYFIIHSFSIILPLSWSKRSLPYHPSCGNRPFLVVNRRLRHPSLLPSLICSYSYP